MSSSSPSPLLLFNGLSLLHSPLLCINSTKIFSRCSHQLYPTKLLNFKLRCGLEKFTEENTLTSRRTVLGLISSLSAFGILTHRTNGAGLPVEQRPRLCDESCEKELENVPMTTTETGLQYKDIQVGVGPTPPVGFQVAANYIAMVPNGQIFDSSLEKGQPYIFRVGSGQVIKGLDEGILSMKIGGKRRLYIPVGFP
ncbi:peptidyl-prolyl cis-trans isomerase FKBP16-3, chloroplastic isoform X2 [Phalaenopsis equestris]|uniref:peptidyl-prolyl cis-trans isomerase FKBP16-3, chloroplastic isoform X2 n=1 Tax=Phalaenopsis equestris TaxID=78828 RepID=UPI0009E18C41|nr:peptidyl-prolyl cis-trans isomerase FKBP16-3, chloroplastic isoform X2 [Phalaenopsis equestris]